MTDAHVLAAATVGLPALVAVTSLAVPRRLAAPVAVGGGLACGGLAGTLAAVALTGFRHPVVSDWLVLDAASGLLLAVIAAVGTVSALLSPAYLASSEAGASVRRYYGTLFAFWAVLMGVPLAGNLGEAWLLVEATTAASALLVGFSGRPRALEAGWKYLVLTSLGLGVALLGIALVAAGVPGAGLGALSWHALGGFHATGSSGLVAYLLLMAGLAAKIGWAPVHNWLPDAHSEAPAPVSALLSAALLPAVLLVAWRCQQGLAPIVGAGTTRSVFIGFGLASIAVSVPFLARSLAFKRLLAYSSLEHMGIVALGIGFASPLALAGVAVHIAGHAIAKTLGFHAVIPLLSAEPRAARQAVAGVGRTQPALGAAIALSLGALCGLPPSPLFVSELLIIAGGFQAGHPWAAAAATLLIAGAFLGLLRSLLDMTAGHRGTGSPDRGTRSPDRGTPDRASRRPVGLRAASVLAACCAVALLALAGASAWLPGTDFVNALMKGIQ